MVGIGESEACVIGGGGDLVIGPRPSEIVDIMAGRVPGSEAEIGVAPSGIDFGLGGDVVIPGKGENEVVGLAGDGGEILV